MNKKFNILTLNSVTLSKEKKRIRTYVIYLKSELSVPEGGGRW